MTASGKLLGKFATAFALSALLAACGSGSDGEPASNGAASNNSVPANNTASVSNSTTTQPSSPVAPSAPTPEEVTQPSAGNSNKQPPASSANVPPQQEETPAFEPFSIQFSWDIPATRANGDPLPVGEIGGYEIYYVNVTGSVAGTITVPGGQNTAAELAILEPGTYMFSIRTYDRDAVYSDLSDPITAVL